MLDQLWTMSESLRAHAMTPYLPCSGSMVSPYLLVLLGISICGSCLAVPVPLHNVAGAPVTTVSPREFVPV